MRAAALVAASLLLVAAAAVALAADAPVVWRASTESPRRVAPPAQFAALYTACGAPDGALAEVAARTAHHHVETGSLPGADETAFALRAAGDPHPSPRVFGITGKSLDDVDVATRFKSWSGALPGAGARRCGIARAERADGVTALEIVSVDAIADIAPLPTSARVGQWITLDGVMLVPASEAKVILLGPRGAPKTVLASLSGGRVRATFSVDAEGSWLVQVLATIATGPQPALEAVVHAGVAAPTQFAPAPAPGEDAGGAVADDGDAVTRMVNGARAAEGFGALTRDKGLDKAAQAHSVAMQRARILGHDVGDGDLTARVLAAGAPPGRRLGENVARAVSLARAHRALWASPSHRTNLLYAGYRQVGVGVVKDADGTVWVTEVFRE